MGKDFLNTTNERTDGPTRATYGKGYFIFKMGLSSNQYKNMRMVRF